MKTKVLKMFIIVVFLVVLGNLLDSPKIQAENEDQQIASGPNLLVNGDMDQYGFYPRPPNHYVAGQWYEWWGNYSTIPEFIDGGHPYHNECYPPPPDGKCHNDYTKVYNNSQGYIRYSFTQFIAGIYQPVHNVTPCTLYTFEIWNRNDASGFLYHPKLGIDPTGWIITRPGGSPPNNCPPDGNSVCPDPYVGDDHGFPNTIIWSEQLTHPGYTWGKGSLTVEAVNSSISVWTYAAPDSSQFSTSTYWDYGSVVQVPFLDQKLPEPDSWSPIGFVNSVSTFYSGSDLIVTWNTLEPSSTQVWYHVIQAQTGITDTSSLTNTTYMPTIHKSLDPLKFSITTLNATPVTNHQAVISGLNDGDNLTFIPLSRRPINNKCVTEVDTSRNIIVDFP